MATVSQQNIDKNYEKIIVNLSKEDYLPEVEKAIKKLSKTANIQGFRKGMVPLGHIKKLYGQSVFADEVLKTADSQLSKHLLDTKVEILARPLPAENQNNIQFDINNPQDFTFEFEIGLKPKFEIPLFQSKKTTPLYKVNITDEMLNEATEDMQYRVGEMKPVEQISDENDVINFDLIFSNEEKNIKRSFLLKYFTPETQNLLKGKKEKDNVSIKLDNAFNDEFKNQILKDLNASDLINQDVTFHIEKIEHIEKAELNKDFFEKIFPGLEIDTEEKFKEKLKTEISNQWDKEVRTHLHNELFETLVHETTIDLPHTFLKRWLSIGGDKFKPMEQVEKEYSGFEHQIRWQLISDKIIDENKIEVKKDEMETAAKMQVINYFNQYGQAPSIEEEWVDDFAKKQLADKKFSNQLYERILTDKVFFTIENSINLQETEISKDEFIKLVQEQQAHHHHHHTHDHDHHHHDHDHSHDHEHHHHNH